MPNKQQRDKIKERIILSNNKVLLGLLPDPWVVSYREKNRIANFKWKRRRYGEPKKAIANSGSFKKGHTLNKKLTEEEKIEYKIRTRAYQKNWRLENKDRLNAELKERRKNDPSFKIKCNLRKRLSSLLRKSCATKTKQTMKLLECDMDYFKYYISSKFTEGMSFDNYGQWHLDHIIPCDSFDLTDPKQQEKCFNYTNFQPLWAVDNRRKSNKL